MIRWKLSLLYWIGSFFFILDKIQFTTMLYYVVGLTNGMERNCQTLALLLYFHLFIFMIAKVSLHNFSTYLSTLSLILALFPVN